MGSDDGRVAVIGAGSSGMAACQVLQERGLPFDCFEKGSDIGGLWRYENDNTLSSAYASLHINTPRKIAQYASYPMPEDYPDFPDNNLVLAYLEDYLEHFALREHIRFRTEVLSIQRVEAVWEVRWRDTDDTLHSDRYAAVLVASGHHWDPRPMDPPLPGSFDGRQLHSHFYRTTDGLEGKNVLVVGMGDSAIDIACDTARVSKITFLAARRGAWILPRYLGSRPLSEIGVRLQSRVPIAREVAGGPLFKIGSRILSRRISSFVGRPDDHGLPRPDHRFGSGIFTGPADIYTQIGLGRVTPKRWISHLDGGQAAFEDGSTEDIDVIVYCTGYKISLPFLADSIVDPENGSVPLYKRVIHPDLPGLYFIGLIDVAGPLNPLAELQAQWIADLLQDKAELPSRARMMQAIAREDDRRQKRFGGRRHAIHVDFVPYLQALRRERKRARRKASHPEQSGRPMPAAHAGDRLPA